ncbi:restriction endonuclease subunit S [Lachnoclostridium sp.]|uniref:restriction endonuclease subunit S n=1 Tax=Lachnoclostridium sp. TaxID=2028282 RepID=UPI0028975977|nr:restriction endonuclease subunit S [Lachnoclostridium sp.]
MREDIKERIEMIKRGEVPVGYKQTKLGIIPEDWAIKQIEDCLERVDNPVNVESDEEYCQIGIRSHGKGLFYKEAVKGKDLGNKKVFWIEPDCFIVNIVFAWEQAVGKTTQSEVGMIASHRFPMYKPIKNRVLIDYLVQYFLTQKGKDVMEYASPGGAGRNRTLGQNRFMKSYIVCPSCSEQGKIAEIMKQCNELIVLYENLIEEKRNQKKYLMKNLLTDKKCFTGGKFNWKKVKLGKLIYEIDERTTENGEYPVLTSSRKGIYYQSDYFKKQVASEDNTGYKIINNGEFTYRAMSDDGNYTFNIQNICDKGLVSPAYSVFSVDEKEAVAGYVYYMMNDNSFNRFLRVLQQGGTRQSLNFRKLCEIEIILPSITQQKTIARVLSGADKEIELLEEQLEQIKLGKKAMRELLLTGIVRVNEY